MHIPLSHNSDLHALIIRPKSIKFTITSHQVQTVNIGADRSQTRAQESERGPLASVQIFSTLYSPTPLKPLPLKLPNLLG